MFLAGPSWPRGLRRRSSAARLLRLRVRIPPGGMDVCCECCVLSGRGLCDGLITRPEESCRLWRVVVCDQETSKTRRLKACYRAVKNTTTMGCNGRKTDNNIYVSYLWQEESFTIKFSADSEGYLSLLCIDRNEYVIKCHFETTGIFFLSYSDVLRVSFVDLNPYRPVVCTGSLCDGLNKLTGTLGKPSCSQSCV